MVFAVHVVRSERQRFFSNSAPLTPRSSASSAAANNRTLSVPIKPVDTFGDVKKLTEQRLKQIHGGQEIEGMRMGTLKGMSGEVFQDSDIIGVMFDADARKNTIQLCLYLEADDSKKRGREEDVEVVESGTAKRRKVQADMLVRSTPPSAQRSTTSSTDFELKAFQLASSTRGGNASLGSTSSKRVARASAAASKPGWSAHEDEKILEGVRKGWNSGKIAQSLGDGLRTSGAVRGRKAYLTKRTSHLDRAPKLLRGPGRTIRTAFGQPPRLEMNTTPRMAEPLPREASPVAEARPNVTVTLPRSASHGTFTDRPDRERWEEAYAGANGDPTQARINHNFIVNREQMLDALTDGDEAEIARLNAQRHRLERQRDESKATSALCRRDLFAGHKILPGNMEPADEDVIRDDDYDTAEEDKVNSTCHGREDIVAEEYGENGEGGEADESGISFVDGPGMVLMEEDDDVDEEERDVSETSVMPSIKEEAPPDTPSPPPRAMKIDAFGAASGLGTLMQHPPFRPTSPRPKPRQETAEETRARLQHEACPYGSDDESEDSPTGDSD